MRIRGRRIRRRYIRKTIWIIITALASIAMVGAMAAPAFLD